MSVQMDRLEAIADAIRMKTGRGDLIKPIDFASEIESIEQGTASVGTLRDLAPRDFVQIPFAQPHPHLRAYMVLRHGAPDSTYHGWGDCTFLLQQMAFSPRIPMEEPLWQNSEPDAWLGNTFPTLIDPAVWALAIEGRLPFADGFAPGTVRTGTNGLLRRAFALSHTEMGIAATGAVFAVGINFGAFADNESRISRTSIQDAPAVGDMQHLRAVNVNPELTPGVQANGTLGPAHTLRQLMTIRPAIALPSNTEIDANNVILT